MLVLFCSPVLCQIAATCGAPCATCFFDGVCDSCHPGDGLNQGPFISSVQHAASLFVAAVCSLFDCLLLRTERLVVAADAALSLRREA
jgi:hypothetical protein